MNATTELSRRVAATSVILHAIREQAAATPDAPAVVTQDGEVSYRELESRIDRLATSLAARGIGRGDVVGILSENRPEIIELWYACAALGAAAATMHPAFTDDELAHAIRLTRPGIFFASSQYASKVSARYADALPPAGVWNIDEQFEVFRGAERNSAIPPLAPVPDETILLLVFTSGTTGVPKAAAISHHAITVRNTAFIAAHGLDRNHHFISWAPMCHTVNSEWVFCAHMQGAAAIVVNGFKPEALAALLREYTVGWFVLFPGTLTRMVEAVDSLDVEVKGVYAVGALADLVPPDQVATLTRRLGARYMNTYGSTEVGLLSIDTIACGEAVNRRPKRLGKWAEVSLQDPEGNPVCLGDVGEVCVRGPFLFSGYWCEPQATDEAFRDGWFRTGDLAVRQPDGRIHFAGRSKFMIKSGGRNIYPAEIENTLRTCPGVDDSVVVSLPDDTWGEVPWAFVIASARSSGLMARARAHCESTLPKYKVPAGFSALTADAVPRNITGKADRRQLAEMARRDRESVDRPPRAGEREAPEGTELSR